MMDFSAGYGVPFFVPFLVIGIIFFVLAIIITWIWSIIDCIGSSLEAEEKLLWIVVILVFNIIGSILYFFLAKSINENRKANHKSTSNKKIKMKRVTRDTDNKVIEGVCAGLGNYFEIDPVVVRLLWVLVTFLTGFFPGVIAYVIAIVIIPEK